MFLLEALGATRAPKVLCCRISSNNSFFGCVSAGGGVTSGTSDRQGAVTVLLHFFKHVFSVFLLGAEGTTPRAFKVLCCRISSNNSFFGCVSAGGGVTSGTTDRQGAVTVLLHFFKHVFSVFLLEAEGTTPRAFKVLCCRISSNNSFFGCVSAGGGVTSGTSNCQGAVTALLHFF